MAENYDSTSTEQTGTIGVPIDSAGAIKAALAKIAGKQIALDKYENYYFGRHSFNFSSEKFTTQFAKRLHTMRDNLCKTAVRAPADRLEVIGFAAEKTSTVYNDSWDIWKYSKMPQLSKRVFRDAFKTGSGFVQVWADSTGRARLVNQDPRQCTVFYDPETNEVEMAAKLWRGLDRLIYLTLFYPDRIEKYVSRSVQSDGSTPKTAAAFQKRTVGGEPWPLPNPYGVTPLFHFGLECSILDDVIPLNDALNKELADLLIGSESNSLRQRWTTGISYEVDPETGKQIIPFERASQWFASKDADSKFGEFKDVLLKDFLEVINDFRSEIANVCGIPQYYFKLGAGDFPSGEALAKAESRFAALITDAQIDFGESWSAAMKLALAIDDKAGEADGEIETQWTPAAPMSDNEKADLAIKKKTFGASNEQLLAEVGYSDAQIAKMKKDNSDAAANAAETFGKVFDSGSTSIGPNAIG
jgi:hypothetical protein